MRKILALFSIASLMLLSSCWLTEDDDRVKVYINKQASSTGQIANARVAAQEAAPYGFSNVYSNVVLTAYDSINDYSPPPFKEANKLMTEILIKEGTYKFTAEGNGSIVYGQSLKFFAETSQIPVYNGSTVYLKMETSQALLLLPTAGLDSIPTIKVWGANQDQYEEIGMFLHPNGNCYYTYVYDSWGYEVNYSKSGVPVDPIQDQYVKGIWYDLDTGLTGISWDEPFV